MKKWEKEHGKVLIQALQPFGDVLQVGFPELASEIEKFPIKSHTLIDAIWQTALPQLGVFDAIFFDSRIERGEAADGKRYSEMELEILCRQSVAQELGQFLYELEHRGQISSELFKKMVKKYHLKVPKKDVYRFEDETASFLKQCLQSHMRKGSRFTCFSRDAISKYEDKQFFETIILDPKLEYHEWTAKISKREALVVLVEKA